MNPIQYKRSIKWMGCFDRYIFHLNDSKRGNITMVDSIIKTLQEKDLIGNNIKAIHNKSGSTDGNVYILMEDNKAKYVLKVDRPQKNTEVEDFLLHYEHISLFPKIQYSTPAKEYILYSYIDGTTHYNRGVKIEWLSILVRDIFNNYEKYLPNDKWGRIGRPIQSWQEWNYRSLEDTKHNWGSLLSIEDYDKVKFIVENMAKNEENETRYILHGDTGVHNFVFLEQKLCGVIDPSPMIGPLLYDFTYAFCSSPDDLDIETLTAAFSLLDHEPVEGSRLIDEVIFQLYCRIGICIHHHPHDLEDYLTAWEYWKNISN